MDAPQPHSKHIYISPQPGNVPQFTLTSFSVSLHQTMSNANVAYPPTAHLYHDESAQKPVVTNVQPCAEATMTLDTKNNGARIGKAERLRGGCVPCPVCTILPVYLHPFLLTCTFRTEVCAGSSQYRVAAVAEG
jgi:hypothetical protein